MTQRAAYRTAISAAQILVL